MSNDVETCTAFIKNCLVDDCIGFWENLRDWEGDDFGNIYYSKKNRLPDPDRYGYQLYNFHEALWNIQRSNFQYLSIPELRNNSDYEYNKEKSVGGQYQRVLSNTDIKSNRQNIIRLGSDSIMNIYWQTCNKQALMEKLKCDKEQEQYKNALEEVKNLDLFIKEIRKYNEDDYDSNWKKFIWLYLQKSNTIGGFVLFPRHTQSINQRRGRTNSPIDDRFDLTLECIRRYYEETEKSEKDSNYNPLFDGLKEDEDFFYLFRKGNVDFKNYTKFFCLDESWVKDGQVLNLLNDRPLDDYDFGNKNNVLLTKDNWWTFYRNIMNRLDARNQQIQKVIEADKLYKKSKIYEIVTQPEK